MTSESRWYHGNYIRPYLMIRAFFYYIGVFVSYMIKNLRVEKGGFDGRQTRKKERQRTDYREL